MYLDKSRSLGISIVSPSPTIYADIFVAVLLLVYVALHISAFALGIHALNSPANCTADVGVGVDFVGEVSETREYRYVS